jgi:RNA polymerase sigma-70 factor (ECF subfamily)
MHAEPPAGYGVQRTGLAAAGTRSDADASMSASNGSADFERLFLPHLDAAFNLARLLVRNPQDAEDVVQESYLRALRAFKGFHGETGRPWFLTIVRNTSFTWLRDNRGRAERADYSEDLYVSSGPTPELESIGRERARGVELCVQQLPSDYREVIVLREMEELSYKEIAEITGVPAGTVMSRLSRARARLAECLRDSADKRVPVGKTQPRGRSSHDLR